MDLLIVIISLSLSGPKLLVVIFVFAVEVEGVVGEVIFLSVVTLELLFGVVV